jgi:hypothetical protein
MQRVRCSAAVFAIADLSRPAEVANGQSIVRVFPNRLSSNRLREVGSFEKVA